MMPQIVSRFLSSFLLSDHFFSLTRNDEYEIDERKYVISSQIAFKTFLVALKLATFYTNRVA